MAPKQSSGWSKIIESITSPLGLFVLIILIANGFLAPTLIFSKLSEEHLFYYALLTGPIMILIIVIIINILVWFKPENLTFTKKEHLEKLTPFGSDRGIVDDIDKLEPTNSPRKEK